MSSAAVVTGAFMVNSFMPEYFQWNLPSWTLKGFIIAVVVMGTASRRNLRQSLRKLCMLNDLYENCRSWTYCRMNSCFVTARFVYLRQLDSFDRFLAICYKGDSFCDFLYGFYHSKPLLKRSLHLMERIFSLSACWIFVTNDVDPA